eukprot:169949-Amphidinium_carterae.1
MLFGLASAVMQFGRWSAFLEAAARRVAHVLLAMYVDDAHVADLSTAKGTGQQLVQDLFAVLGSPVAPHKHQPMAGTVEFLGLVADVSHAFSLGLVEFWPKPALVQKILALIAQARSKNALTPADASKLRGTLSFASHAMYGRIGRAAAGPLRQRQYVDRAPWTLSHALERTFEFYEALLLTIRPRRVVRIVRMQAITQQPVIWPLMLRLILSLLVGSFGYVVFAAEHLQAWGYSQERLDQGGNPIALCEGAMVPTTLHAFGARFASRRVVYFIDNTASLHSMVRGCAREAVLDRCVSLTHLLCAQYQIHIWLNLWILPPTGVMESAVP